MRVLHLLRKTIRSEQSQSLESIKDKLQILSERSDTAKHAEEADRIAVCNLTDDLRDVIVECQVSTSIGRHMQDVHSHSLWFAQWRATYNIRERHIGNFQFFLYICCYITQKNTILCVKHKKNECVFS